MTSPLLTIMFLQSPNICFLLRGTMNFDTFIATLESTARIACCAGLVGSISCQTNKKNNTEVPPIEKETEQKTNQSTNTVEKSNIPTINPKKKTEAFLKCDATISQFFKTKESVPPTKEIPKEVMDCCQLQENHIQSMAVEWSNRFPCCTAFNWSGSAACTPWGPPMPPSIS